MLIGTGAVAVRSVDGECGVLTAPIVFDGQLHAALHLLPGPGPIDFADSRWSPQWTLTSAAGVRAPALGGGASGGPDVMSLVREFSLAGVDIDGEWTLAVHDRAGRYTAEGTVTIDSRRGSLAMHAAAEPTRGP